MVSSLPQATPLCHCVTSPPQAQTYRVALTRHPLPHSCARHRNPATARLRRERTLRGRAQILSRPRTWAHWIPVTSTGMREERVLPSPDNNHARYRSLEVGTARDGNDRTRRRGSGCMGLVASSSPTLPGNQMVFPPQGQTSRMKLTPQPLPHSCARHRNPATALLRRERTPCGRTQVLSRPRTWAHWIPVTSTGMRESLRQRPSSAHPHTAKFQASTAPGEMHDAGARP